MPLNFVNNKHLLSRASFGFSPSELKRIESLDTEKLVNLLLNNSSRKLANQISAEQRAITKKLSETKKLVPSEMKLKRRFLFDTQINWIENMSEDFNKGNPFLERMTLFWHDHFACRIKDYRIAQTYIDTLRKDALGSFRDLLHGIAKDPGMIRYLNNKQNKKGQPNENFARELLELFSLGIGNYTEKDIKEAARSFTGWNSNRKGEYVFMKQRYDDGVKTFLGRSGNFTGEEIIDIVLEQKQTARYITTKIYKYFVNEKPNKQIIESLAEQFLKSDYNIKELMVTIFKSDWFYDADNIGNKIKSPIDLIVGLKKLLNIKFSKFSQYVYLQRILGQELLNPPNVAGWEGDLKWINNSVLVYRLKLSHLLLNKENYNLGAKVEQEGFNFSKKEQNRFSDVSYKIGPLYKMFQSTIPSSLNTQISNMILPSLDYDFANGTKSLVNKEQVIKEVLNVTSLPEYQMA